MKSSNLKTPGQRIAALRISEGLTQDDLAGLMFVSRDVVAKWENDSNRSIPNQYLVRLSEHFKVSCDYLLGTSKAESRSATIQNIHKTTGLSEAAIRALNSYIDHPPIDTPRNLNYSEMLSRLISDTAFRHVVFNIHRALEAQSKLFTDEDNVKFGEDQGKPYATITGVGVPDHFQQAAVNRLSAIIYQYRQEVASNGKKGKS